MCQFETLAGHFGLASDFSDNIFVFLRFVLFGVFYGERLGLGF